jgi:hypothetical protein
MLFHVTMTHSADNCPAYHTALMPDVLTSFEKLDEISKELNVKAHALLWGAPAHVAFAVLEADNISVIGRYLNSIAITQDFNITPVQNLKEVIEYGKAALARARK